MAKKYILELNKNQLRALSYLINENPCSCECCYEEMLNSRKECEDCKFQKAQYELMEKIEALTGDMKL